jgi:hypothetical protein
MAIGCSGWLAVHSVFREGMAGKRQNGCGDCILTPFVPSLSKVW